MQQVQAPANFLLSVGLTRLIYLQCVVIVFGRIATAFDSTLPYEFYETLNAANFFLVSASFVTCEFYYFVTITNKKLRPPRGNWLYHPGTICLFYFCTVLFEMWWRK